MPHEIKQYHSETHFFFFYSVFEEVVGPASIFSFELFLLLPVSSFIHLFELRVLSVYKDHQTTAFPGDLRTIVSCASSSFSLNSTLN